LTANGYAYALSNPVGFTDHSGLAAEPSASGAGAVVLALPLSNLAASSLTTSSGAASVDWGTSNSSPWTDVEEFVENESNVNDAVNYLATGYPPIPISYPDTQPAIETAFDADTSIVSGALGVGFSILNYLLNPPESGCSPSMETCEGYLTPSAQIKHTCSAT
jgi:hypothetical protein